MFNKNHISTLLHLILLIALMIGLHPSQAVLAAGRGRGENDITVQQSLTITDALPDLIIVSITPQPAIPAINEAVTFEVVIKNQGLANAGAFYVDLFIDEPIPDDCYRFAEVYWEVQGLAAGESQTLTLKYTGFTWAGAHTINGIVDTNCDITESDVNNNTRVITIDNNVGNDDIGGATVIVSKPYQSNLDTSTASEHADDPAVGSLCDGELLEKGLATVWYQYTPATSGNVFMDTLGSNYDTYLAVWTGTRNNLSLVACDNNTATTSQSQLSFFGTAGTPYYIEVAQYHDLNVGRGGSLQFHITSFADVPGNHMFWRYIEGFYAQGVTTGCLANPLSYCPDRELTRAEMAVFILRAKHGASHIPDPVQINLFADVPVTGKEWMQPWVEEFYEEGITTGCGNNPLLYCPEGLVTREAMAVFLLRAKNGPGYAPPPASNPPLFSDVPVAGKEWMQPWIEEFYRQGYTTGCAVAPLRYCPEGTINRAAMAVFISRVFNIPQLP